MKNAQRRILHVTSGLGVGGAETMLYRLVKSLHGREGQEHAVVSLTDNCSFDFATIEVPVDIVALKPNPLAGFSKLQHLLRERKPDVIQAWMYHGNIAATLACPPQVPVAWSIHHSLHDLQNEKPINRFLIKAGALLSRSGRTQRIVYVSEKSLLHHSDYGYSREKALVIPNGFDFHDFFPDRDARRAVRQELKLADDDLIVGSFGRYHPVKDHDLLLQAFAMVTAEIPNARMLLAGTGMDEANAELGALIRALGLSDRVTLLGQRQDMPRLYNALDLYVLSSKSESFPNVLGEAAACGVPSVTTDVGDAAQIIGAAGKVVPPGGTEAMRDAMRQMLTLSPPERSAFGSQARQRVLERFALQMVVDAYASLYEELSAPTGGIR